MVAFQSVISVLVAAAVGWHTVAGCCAHHGHAETHTLSPIADATPHDHARSGHGCCGTPPDSDPEPRGHAHDSGAEPAEPIASGPGTGAVGHHGCPRKAPSDCTESRCAFVASNASTWQALHAEADNAACSIETGRTAAHSLNLAPALQQQRLDPLCGTFLGHAARRHLALSILVL